MIHCILNYATDPAFNLALEEALLTKTEGSFFLLQCNSPCMILGKHQNIFREINAKEVHKDGIPALRRISGGGTVYHDLGNLNFSFILPANPAFVAGAALLPPIMAALKKLGIESHILGKTHLGVENLKISGNAQAVIKNRMLHHGTLLYQADLQQMKKYLKRSQGCFEDRAVNSEPRSVINLSSGTDASMQELERELAFAVLRWWKEESQDKKGDPDRDGSKLQDIVEAWNRKAAADTSQPFCLTLPREHHQWSGVLGQELWEDIQQLAKEKYQAWEWNYGYPMTMSYTRTREVLGQRVTLWAKVKNGFFQEVQWAAEEKGMEDGSLSSCSGEERIEMLEPKPESCRKEAIETSGIKMTLERWTALLESQPWDYSLLMDRCKTEPWQEELMQFLF